MHRAFLNLFFSALFTSALMPLSAQVVKVKNVKGCAFYGTMPGSVQFDLGATPGGKIKGYIDTVLTVGIITGGEILLRAADSVKNAVATEYEEKRYILYNPDFLKQFELGPEARWKAYSVLAHEVGHHVNKHNFKETNCDVRKKMEREADEYAGKVLRGLCSTREGALAALRSLPKNQPPGSCYPSQTLRVKMTGEAFDAQDSIYKAQPQQDPCGFKVNNVQLIYKVAEAVKNTDPWAHVYNDSVVFNLTIPFRKKNKNYFTRIVVDEYARDMLRMKSFRWKDNPFTPGEKTLVWKFKKDQLDKKTVEEQLHLVNVCTFKKNPEPTSGGELFLWGLGTAVGAGSAVFAGIQYGQSQDLIKRYRQYKSPNADVYTKAGAISRDQTKDRADTKLTIGVYLGTVGTGLVIYSLIKLIKRSGRNHRNYILIPNN